MTPATSNKEALDTLFPWRYRRFLLFSASTLYAGILCYLTGWGTDNPLNHTLAIGSFAGLSANVGSYVFGAVWHDRGLMGALGRIFPGAPDTTPPSQPPSEGTNANSQ